MTQIIYQPEERAHRYRELSEQAISQALNSQWDDAVQSNKELLGEFPRDLSALNRLGKALSELGRYSDARQAYSDALAVDPENNIARKNLDRLAPLKDAAVSGKHRNSARLDPRLFIEETGKTVVTALVDLAPRDVLAKLSPGDEVFPKPDGTAVYITNAGDRRIGRVEQRLAARLLRFIETGNKYAAGISDLGDGAVRVIIREIFQSPANLGRVSFPAPRTGETVRAYFKDTLLRHDLEEEDDSDDGDYADEAEEEEQEETLESDDFRENDFIDREG